MTRRRRFRLSVEPLEGRIALSDCDGMDAADWVAEMPGEPPPDDTPADGGPVEPDPAPFDGDNPPTVPLPPTPVGPAGPAL